MRARSGATCTERETCSPKLFETRESLGNGACSER